MKYYILMADIISSSKKDASRLKKQFITLIDDTNDKFKNHLLSPLTITLGDEFQGVPDSLRTANRIIIFIEEHSLKLELKFKLRFVLIHGKIETDINPAKAHGMLGSGLSYARSMLTSIKKKKLRFKLDLDNQAINVLLNRYYKLYQGVRDDWREVDYKLISELIENFDYKEVAKKLNKDPSLIWRRRNNLKIESYNIIKELILEFD